MASVVSQASVGSRSATRELMTYTQSNKRYTKQTNMASKLMCYCSTECLINESSANVIKINHETKLFIEIKLFMEITRYSDCIG